MHACMHLWQRAALAESSNQLDVGEIVRLAVHLLHIAPELKHLLDQVDCGGAGQRPYI